MLKLIIFCISLGILSTCLGSFSFWHNLITRRTIWGDSENNGVNKNTPFLRGQIEFFFFTLFVSFITYYFFSDRISFFCWGTFASIICVGLCHIWSIAFDTIFKEKKFIAKLVCFILILIIYINAFLLSL